MHYKRPIAQRFNVMDDGQRKDKRENGECTDADQNDVDGAVKALAASTAVARLKVPFVVGAHVRGNTGYVVAPTRKDIAYDLIGALYHHSCDSCAPACTK